jgi:hypothetical protein
MKKWILFFISIVFIYGDINADIMAEISKRDRDNPIRLIEDSAYVLYAKDGYLYTEL